MQHNDIWRALDALAADNGLSASGLARKAGLDPTAFNPSKRTGPDGRARWPSTESVAKVLGATGTGMDAFASLVTGATTGFRSAARAIRRIPLIGLAQAGFTGATVDFTHEVAPGLHGAIVRATKPAGSVPSPAASACCSHGENAGCCEPAAKANCCGTAAVDGAAPPSACGCR